MNEPPDNGQLSGRSVDDSVSNQTTDTTNDALKTGRTAVLVSDRVLFRKTFSKLLQVIETSLVIRELDTTSLMTQGGEQALLLPASDTGLVLIDAGGKDEQSLQLVLLAILTRQPEASLLVVLDEQDDELVEAAMQAGALGVMIKAAPPQVLIDMLQRGLSGDRFRPAPAIRLAHEDLPEKMRQQLTARQQKLLRLMIGGHSISATASELGLTAAKVVTEMRVVLGIVRGRQF